MAHRDIRLAAESLLTQQSQDQIHASITSLLIESEVASLSSLSSINRVNESIITGANIDGRMSTVRRSFCLFVLFDILSVVFVWLILILLSDPDLIDCFKKEILHYTFKTSRFDLVMAAACRFTILLLFHGVLQLKTKFFVAISTFSTSFFILMKIIFFDWSQADQKGLFSGLLLISFCLSWTETWYFDSRVLPMENCAAEEQLYRVRIRDRMRSRQHNRIESEGASQYYSPAESDSELEDGDGEKSAWVQTAEKTVNEIYTLVITDRNCWQLQKQDVHASVFTRTLPRHGVVYYLKFSVRLPLINVKKELFDNISQMASWNAAITVSRRIQLISDSCDVIYQATHKSVISAARDMILVRKCTARDNYTIIACVSINHPAAPEDRKYTRVKCGPCGWILQQCESDPAVTVAHFLMNTELKLLLPQTALVVPVVNSLLQVAAGLQKKAERDTGD